MLDVYNEVKHGLDEDDQEEGEESEEEREDEVDEVNEEMSHDEDEDMIGSDVEGSGAGPADATQNNTKKE